MKMKLFLMVVALFFHPVIHAQSGSWTWMKGDSTTTSAGNYGTQGVAASTNEPPARFSPAFWTDTAGNFWIYGGTEYDTSGAPVDFWDMWKFDPFTLMWTWMNGPQVDIHDPLLPLSGIDGYYFDHYAVIAAPKGVYSPQNSPGSIGHGVPAWVTHDNHLWLFGGELYDTLEFQSNLWQYDPINNQWAWMGNFGSTRYGVKGTGDSTTMPGPRFGANSSWVDKSGNLWLFSDQDNSGTTLNDMWRYDFVSGIWTWMSGSKFYNDTGYNGIKGIPSTSNCPWSRFNNFFWQDESGNFWLIGGLNGNGCPMEDIWKFNPVTMEWTWVGGPSGPSCTQTPNLPFGNICDSSYLNNGGDRFWNSTVWKICDDLIITYGGASTVTVFPPTSLDDVWGYLPTLNEWIKLADVPLRATSDMVRKAFRILKIILRQDLILLVLLIKKGGCGCLEVGHTTLSRSMIYGNLL